MLRSGAFERHGCCSFCTAPSKHPQEQAMARADLILKLVDAGASGDQARFQKTAEAIAAEERAQNHTILADRLLARLRPENNGQRQHQTPLQPRMPDSNLIAEIYPERRISDLVLQSATSQAVNELVQEQFRADLLRAHGIEPRNRILLVGAPGNGKTSLAEAIACEMHVPMLMVRYESVIGSFLGETARRICKVFEHARSRHCVLFFDEFDVVGKERGDVHETGEIKRVVSSLLLQVDALPSYVVVLAASNHPELLDRAVWRRFQLRLEMPSPTQEAIESWFERFEKRTRHRIGIEPAKLLSNFKGLSFSEIEDFGQDVLRQYILQQPGADVRKIAAERLRQMKTRFEMKKSRSIPKTAQGNGR